MLAPRSEPIGTEVVSGVTYQFRRVTREGILPDGRSVERGDIIRHLIAIDGELVW
ncbi:MAG: hypothetical protein AAGG69_02205 [Pseudomonadota bacterium]